MGNKTCHLCKKDFKEGEDQCMCKRCKKRFHHTCFDKQETLQSDIYRNCPVCHKTGSIQRFSQFHLK